MQCFFSLPFTKKGLTFHLHNDKNNAARKKARIILLLVLYSYADAHMDKKPFFLTFRSASLRALFILILVAAVILSLGHREKSRSMDASVEQSYLHKSITPGSAVPLATEAFGDKIDTRAVLTKIDTRPTLTRLDARTTIASNYTAMPARTRPSSPLGHNVKRPSLSPPNITRGNIHSTMISVTFDGGIGSRQAGEILDILKERKIKTTIFLSGNFIRNNPDITRRILADGHEVGNHTTTHPHLTQFEINGTQKTLPHVTKALLLDELNTAERRFFEVTGQHMSPLWRAPYGEINSTLRAWAFSAGYLHIGWTYDARSGKSLDSLDWVSDKASRLYHGPMEIKKKIIDFDKKGGGLGGGIVLMHLDTDRGTDRASSVLGEILDNLLERGFSLVKISDLIVNQRLLREAKVKKEKFDNRVRFTRKGPTRHKFNIHVQRVNLPG